MSNRGQKRTEVVDKLPADKRACSSLEFRPNTASSSGQTVVGSVHEAQDADMDTSSSTSGSTRSEGDLEKESAYGSCDSDYSIHDYYRNRVMGVEQTKFKKVLTSLSEEMEESAQLALLTELCELLSFCSDNSISSLMVDSFSPILVRFAKHDSNPDIMLLAIRAITYLCDVNPRASGFLVRHDAVPALCKILMAIEYLDVAEQCLQALLKISREQPLACLQSGTIMAVLSFIDFFSTSVQRLALSAVVNICKKLSSESPSLFMDAVPILCNLLQYEDKPLVESAATCLIRIGEQVHDSSDMLDEICKHGIVQHTIHLMGSNSRTTLCEPTYIGLIGLLAKLASGSTVAFKTLFELNISNTIKDMLSTFSATHGTQSIPMVDWQHSQIYEILKLLNELLPAITAEQDDQQKSDKEAFLLNHPDVMQKFGIDLLSVLIQVVNSGVNLFICYGCLSIINKLVHFSTSDTLHSLLQTACFSSFLAGVFWRKDHHVVLLALQIVDAIMLKLPHVYLNSFIKEGVLFAINALLSPDKDLKLSPVFDGIRLENDAPLKSVGQDAPRCPCFAYTTLSLKPPENGTCKLQKDTVHILANHIWTTYFETESLNPERGVSDILQKLRTWSASLTSVVDVSLLDPLSCQYEEEICNLLKQIISELNEKDSISTFEFVESGIIKALVYCLSNGRHLSDEEENSAPNSMCVIEKRFQIFGRLLLFGGSSSHEESPLLTLIRRLQSALSSVENFPVIPNLASKRRNSYATVPYGHCTSYPCLKVQFVRETEAACLRDYSEDVVNVDPFVPIEEIEEYLWPRVSNGKAKQLLSKCKDLKERDGSGSHSQSDSNTDQRSADVLAPIEMLVDFHQLQERESNFLPTSVAEASTVGHRATNSAEVTDIVTDPVQLAEHDPLHENADNNQPGCSDSECSSARLLLFLEGQQLKSKLTLYQTILSLKTQTENDSVLSSSLWTRFYKITYRRQVTIKPTSSKQNNDVEGCSLLSKRASFCQQSPIFSIIFGSEVDIEKLDPTYDILSLLKCLEGINRLRSSLASRERASAFAQGKADDLDRLNVVACDVSQNEFVSKKLTEKLEQQMQDPMAASIGALPSWCTQLMAWCPFLFSFEARCKYFHMAALGRLPIQTHSVSHGNAGGSSSRQQSHGSVPRKKILVHRDKILDSATRMMELHARQKVFVEVEYNEEVGTGLGPTLEFYTLVCREFQKCGLGLWRDDSVSPLCTPVSDDENSGLLDSPFGLFPRPWSPSLSISSNGTYSDVVEKFSLLGQIVARSLQDGRVLDLPFSRAFYKIMLDKELALYDIQLFDPAFGKVLSEFQAIIERKEYLRSLCGEQSRDSDVRLRNTKIEDLCLDFTLPGYPDYALVSDSDSKMVDHSNLEEYIKLIVDATTKSGIARQVDAFKSGFDKVFPISHLKVFTEEELELLLCGEHVLWNSDELLDHIKFDHGYTISSPPIINLLSIMNEFNLEQQRAFLQFMTGTPRLPIGGLASLNPKLTIVRKHCSKGIDADLPSVMTCANYLKLPPYTTKEVMKEKLMYAITEGQGSFHLS